MPDSPAIGTIIEVAQISQVLALLDSKNTLAVKYGFIDAGLPKLLYAVRKGVEWAYNKDNNDPTLFLTGNYLWALCGRYQQRALQSLNVGGITIVPETGQLISIQFRRFQFTVGQPGSLFTAGDVTHTWNESNIQIDSFSILPSGVEMMLDDSFQFSYDILYTTSSVITTFNQAVEDGQQYIVRYVRVGNAGSVPNTGLQIPNPTGHEGEVLFTDGINLYWGVPLQPITSANFEPDGKTYLNTDLADNNYAVLWTNTSHVFIQEEPNPELTQIVGGGFVINIEGFDTTSNPDWRFLIFITGKNA